MSKKKIILDCDPGHDDAVAIMLAAASDTIDILGITCVAGNTTLENTTENALKICSLIGRSNIKIYAGASKPIIHDLVTAAHVHGKSGLDIEGKEIKIVSILKSTLSADHRVLDGSVAAKLLKDFHDIIENPFDLWLQSKDMEVI